MFNKSPEIIYFNKDVSLADSMASIDRDFSYEHVKSFVNFNFDGK